MEHLDEFAKDVVDRYIKSMGYNPQTIDRNKRMALTKTVRFQQFAQRMQEELMSEQPVASSAPSVSVKPTTQNKPSAMGMSQSRVHTKDMALKRSVHVNKPQGAVKTEALEFPGDDGINPKGSSSKVVGERAKQLSKSARMIKAIYKKHKAVKEELYDHEKDDKDGGTYGQKPKLAKIKGDQQNGQNNEGKSKAAAVLTGGTTLTGQKRDDVEFDPMLSKPNMKSDASGMQIKAKKINK
jgi:hypothetical protein